MENQERIFLKLAFSNSFGLSCSRNGGLVILPSRFNLSKARCHLVQQGKKMTQISRYREFVSVSSKWIWNEEQDMIFCVDLIWTLMSPLQISSSFVFILVTATCMTMYELKLRTNYKFLLEYLASLLLSISPLITNYF